MSGVPQMIASMSQNSGSSGKNKSSWSFGQDIWEGQKQPLKDLYSQASQLYSQFDPEAMKQMSQFNQDYQTKIANEAMPSWQNQLSGGMTSPLVNQTQNSLANSLNRSLNSPSNTGRMYQSIVGGPGNTYIDPMVSAMKRGVMDNLNRQMPGLGEQAISAGQYGSSRHGIAEGLMRSDANRDMMQQEANMRAGAYDTDLNWKMQIAQLADQNIGASQDRAIDLINSQNQSAQNAINLGQLLSGYGQNSVDSSLANNDAQWQQLGNWGNIIGDPTVLSSGSGMSSSKSKSYAKGK